MKKYLDFSSPYAQTQHVTRDLEFLSHVGMSQDGSWVTTTSVITKLVRRGRGYLKERLTQRPDAILRHFEQNLVSYLCNRTHNLAPWNIHSYPLSYCVNPLCFDKIPIIVVFLKAYNFIYNFWDLIIIKNCFKNIFLQFKLTNFAILSIQQGMSDSFDCNEIVDIFATAKARKKQF